MLMQRVKINIFYREFERKIWSAKLNVVVLAKLKLYVRHSQILYLLLIKLKQFNLKYCVNCILFKI